MVDMCLDLWLGLTRLSKSASSDLNDSELATYYLHDFIDTLL
jgi:hypothetical protein